MKNTLKALLFGLLLVGASVNQVAQADWTETETTIIENGDLDDEILSGENTNTDSDEEVIVEEDFSL